jgi:hypothetical protein
VAVIVREQVKHSGEWWVFINHKGKRRDSSERWEAHYFCVDFKNAIVALAELRMPLIHSSVPDELRPQSE